MTELFSIVGFYIGWRAQHGNHFNVSATFDGVPWSSGDMVTAREADQAFYRAARRAFLRKWLGKLGISIAPPGS